MSELISGYMSVKEAAEILGVNTSRICQLCRSGELESVKFQKVWLVSEKAVQARYDNPPEGVWGAKHGKRVE